MPRLTLLRHAQAGDAPPGGDDFDRALTGVGISTASALPATLRALPPPDRLRASPSRRTKQTAELACVPAWPSVPLALDDALYLASVAQLLQEIRTTSDDCAHLLIVGHNPGLSELWSLLGDEPGFGGLAPGDWRSRAFDGAWAALVEGR